MYEYAAGKTTEHHQRKRRAALRQRLMTLLNALDQDIEIVIRKKPRSRAAARISVVAA